MPANQAPRLKPPAPANRSTPIGRRLTGPCGPTQFRRCFATAPIPTSIFVPAGAQAAVASVAYYLKDCARSTRSSDQFRPLFEGDRQSLGQSGRKMARPDIENQYLSAERSALMARIRGKNTKPELLVRRHLHAAGYRFRLHRKDLPGTPDIVLPRYRLAIFVHGCFWHRHSGCPRATSPKTREHFWAKKFARNVSRDQRNQADLAERGWRVMVIWECEVRNTKTLAEAIASIRDL